MYLFRDIMDKQLADCNGDKCGKVDDLILELRPGELPAVKALVTGHHSLLELSPGWLRRLGLWIEARMLGTNDLAPKVVGWEHVSRIDVTVQVDVDRRESGLIETQQAVWRRWIEPLPWSER